MSKPQGWYAIRLVARRKRRTATFQQRAAIATFLSDSDVQGAVLERLHGDYQIAEFGDGTLLDWFLEHWDEILEIILTIIGLFSA